ncbi:MAG: tetratricopeptide repeat protein [Phycisphaerae bacterium]|nr:tetratricopeptide repeat protein [Phycisphaerae bacterium]NUQ07946.1 tetratricopeptide repeat protein [Phycisphaerae bacterium]
MELERGSVGEAKREGDVFVGAGLPRRGGGCDGGCGVICVRGARVTSCVTLGARVAGGDCGFVGKDALCFDSTWSACFSPRYTTCGRIGWYDWNRHYSYDVRYVDPFGWNYAPVEYIYVSDPQVFVIDDDGAPVDAFSEAPPPPAEAPASEDGDVLSFTTITPGADPLIDEAVAVFASGRYVEARRLFARAVVRDPGDPYAHLLYAMTWVAEGDYTLAYLSTYAALTQADDILTQPLDLAPLYPDASVLDAQLERLTWYVTEHPDDSEARFLLAYLFFTIEDVPAARVVLEPVSSVEADELTARLAEVLGRLP